MSANTIIGVDVGGTFTDLVLLDPTSGSVRLAKTLSTLDNQAYGVLQALKDAKAVLSDAALIVHGTTTTTNAVLERKLSKTGLITTEGFRDVLELGRRTRPQPYGMKGVFTPVIPRDLRLEASERMDASGEVVIPLDEEAVSKAASALLDAGCEALVIHFLHSYANPAHERRAAAVAAEIWPNDYITMGHALLSETREFERGVTAAVNASVQPLLERYLRRLSDELAAGGYRGDVLVMNGNGGMASARSVSREAAKTVMSGPASGVMAAAYTGRRAGAPDLITYDMGGTSTDVALIRGGEPSVSNEIEVEYAMPIHVPMVDVRTVGAGGGSIAKVTSAGLLEVGPESSGSDPGPICYGRGGRQPTISDANLLLGRLDPSGLKAIDGGAARDEVASIFEESLDAPLGLSAEDAAEAVIRIANAKMAGAIRMVSLSLGADPRDFALFAFGGAGPLHAAALARELGVPQVLVPARPGVTNALGCVVADLRHDFVRTVGQMLDTCDLDAVHALIAEQIAEGERLLAEEVVEFVERRCLIGLDMQFAGQSHVVRVPFDSPTPTREEIRGGFEAVYWDRFRVELPEIRARIVNVATSVIGARKALDLSTLIEMADEGSVFTPRAFRAVRFDGEMIETPFYARESLPPGAELEGPAIVEQMDTTILIPPGDRARVAPTGDIFIEIGAGS